MIFALAQDGFVVDRHNFPEGATIQDGAVTWIEDREVTVEGDGGEIHTETQTVTVTIPAPAGAFYIDDADAQIGYEVVGDIAVAPALPPHPPPALVPITRRQLRLTLLAHGLLDQVEPTIVAMPEPERSEALIEWQDASEYERDNPLLLQVATALSLTELQVDGMWLEAMAR